MLLSWVRRSSGSRDREWLSTPGAGAALGGLKQKVMGSDLWFQRLPRVD